MKLYPKRKNGRFSAFQSFFLLVIVFVFSLNALVRAEAEEIPRLCEVPKETASTKTVWLERKETGKKEELPFDDYLIGVVAAEMPVNFETEALKAQAVIARTYALNRITGEGEKTALCDDPDRCQAFYDIDQLRDAWGNDFDTNYDRVKKAVEATEDIVLTYNGELARTY